MLGYVAIAAVGLIALQFWPGNRADRNPAGNAAGPHPDQLDFEVREPLDNRLGPDEFLSFPATEPNEQARARDSRQQAAIQEGTRIAPQVLAAVKDNTLGIRRDEADAFYEVLDRARQTPLERLEQAAPAGVQYLNIMTDPTLYRGHPVTLVGDMWRLYEFPANENLYGIQTLYEAWIFTADSGTHPTRVVCSSLDPALQPGEAQRTPVKVTGYFFKREGYNTPGGLHVAPTILAGRLQPYHSPNAPPPADSIVSVMLTVVVGIGLILTTTLLSFAVSDRRTPRSTKRLPQLSAETTDQLAQLDVRSVSEQLRELEEQDRWASWSKETGVTARPHEQNGHPEATPPDALELPTPLPPTRPPRPTSLE